MTAKELLKIHWVLCEAERVDDGSGHWLPETYAKELREAIELIEIDLREAGEVPPKYR